MAPTILSPRRVRRQREIRPPRPPDPSGRRVARHNASTIVPTPEFGTMELTCSPGLHVDARHVRQRAAICLGRHAATRADNDEEGRRDSGPSPSCHPARSTSGLPSPSGSTRQTRTAFASGLCRSRFVAWRPRLAREPRLLCDRMPGNGTKKHARRDAHPCQPRRIRTRSAPA